MQKINAFLNDGKSRRWKTIDGYDDQYLISDIGEVASFKQGKIKLLVPADDFGYLRVVLSKKNKRKNLKIHRLVAQYFVQNKRNVNAVNHIDGNTKNNRYDNLEWCTTKENCLHAWKIGLCETVRKRAKENKGEKHQAAKLTEKNILYIRKNYKRNSYHVSNAKDLAKMFNVTKAAIIQIISKVTWNHV